MSIITMRDNDPQEKRGSSSRRQGTTRGESSRRMGSSSRRRRSASKTGRRARTTEVGNGQDSPKEKRSSGSEKQRIRTIIMDTTEDDHAKRKRSRSADKKMNGSTRLRSSNRRSRSQRDGMNDSSTFRGSSSRRLDSKTPSSRSRRSSDTGTSRRGRSTRELLTPSDASNGADALAGSLNDSSHHNKGQRSERDRSHRRAHSRGTMEGDSSSNKLNSSMKDTSWTPRSSRASSSHGRKNGNSDDPISEMQDNSSSNHHRRSRFSRSRSTRRRHTSVSNNNDTTISSGLSQLVKDSSWNPRLSHESSSNHDSGLKDRLPNGSNHSEIGESQDSSSRHRPRFGGDEIGESQDSSSRHNRPRDRSTREKSTRSAARRMQVSTLFASSGDGGMSKSLPENNGLSQSAHQRSRRPSDGRTVREGSKSSRRRVSLLPKDLAGLVAEFNNNQQDKKDGNPADDNNKEKGSQRHLRSSQPGKAMDDEPKGNRHNHSERRMRSSRRASTQPTSTTSAIANDVIKKHLSLRDVKGGDMSPSHRGKSEEFNLKFEDPSIASMPSLQPMNNNSSRSSLNNSSRSSLNASQSSRPDPTMEKPLDISLGVNYANDRLKRELVHSYLTSKATSEAELRGSTNSAPDQSRQRTNRAEDQFRGSANSSNSANSAPPMPNPITRKTSRDGHARITANTPMPPMPTPLTRRTSRDRSVNAALPRPDIVTRKSSSRRDLQQIKKEGSRSEMKDYSSESQLDSSSSSAHRSEYLATRKQHSRRNMSQRRERSQRRDIGENSRENSMKKCPSQREMRREGSRRENRPGMPRKVQSMHTSMSALNWDNDLLSDSGHESTETPPSQMLKSGQGSFSRIRHSPRRNSYHTAYSEPGQTGSGQTEPGPGKGGYSPRAPARVFPRSRSQRSRSPRRATSYVPPSSERQDMSISLLDLENSLPTLEDSGGTDLLEHSGDTDLMDEFVRGREPALADQFGDKSDFHVRFDDKRLTTEHVVDVGRGDWYNPKEIANMNITSWDDEEGPDGCWRGIEHIQMGDTSERKMRIQKHVQSVKIKQRCLNRKQKNDSSYDAAEELRIFSRISSVEDRKQAKLDAQEDTKFVVHQAQSDKKRLSAEPEHSKRGDFIAMLNPIAIADTLVGATSSATKTGANVFFGAVAGVVSGATSKLVSTPVRGAMAPVPLGKDSRGN